MPSRDPGFSELATLMLYLSLPIPDKYLMLRTCPESHIHFKIDDIGVLFLRSPVKGHIDN